MKKSSQKNLFCVEIASCDVYMHIEKTAHKKTLKIIENAHKNLFRFW